MPRGKAESDLAKAHPPCHWLDLPRLPLLRILEIVHATSSLQNPACVCRSWHTAAHEIRLGDTASSRPARRLAISQGSGQKAQTLQTCAGVFVAEGASSGFEACSRPRWRHDQCATSSGREQQAPAADEGSPAQRLSAADTDQATAAAAAAAPGIDASAGPSQVAVQAGPADTGSPTRGVASRKRRRDRDWSGDTGGPQTKLERSRMATRASASAGVAAEPVTQTMVDQSRRRAPDASRERGPALASTLGDAPPDCRQMRVRSAALKLHAARLAAERAGLSAPTGSDVASPSAEASEDGTSDASGAASLAEGAAVGDDDPAGGRPQTLCGWLLRLVGRR